MYHSTPIATCTSKRAVFNKFENRYICIRKTYYRPEKSAPDFSKSCGAFSSILLSARIFPYSAPPTPALLDDSILFRKGSQACTQGSSISGSVCIHMYDQNRCMSQPLICWLAAMSANYSLGLIRQKISLILKTSLANTRKNALTNPTIGNTASRNAS